ncbi:MAG TPA: response regulator [Candidatus Bathyarchaeia archaeon]|nr:response regulator [Candidatus Bathyarchaeia archaeon]
MIAEDEPDVAQIIAEKLRDRGYQSTVVDNGEDALRLMRTEAPDLLISDIVMPRLNGEDLIRQMKSDPLLCRIPCIVITAKIGIDDLQKIWGIQGFLEKPFTMRELLAAIENVFAASDPDRMRETS